MKHNNEYPGKKNTLINREETWDKQENGWSFTLCKPLWIRDEICYPPSNMFPQNHSDSTQGFKTYVAAPRSLTGPVFLLISVSPAFIVPTRVL